MASSADPTASLQAAIDHLERGDVPAALKAAGEACIAAPAMAEAHHVHGKALMASQQFADAERAFAAALQLKPAWAEARVDYALSLHGQGKLDDAKTAVRQALHSEPGHAVAAARLAAFLRVSGENDEAESLLRGVIERAPENFGARLTLAADLLQDERPAEALALLDAGKVPVGDKDAARHWMLLKSLALLQLGRADIARAAMDVIAALGPVPPALTPSIYWRLILLAILDGDTAGARQKAGRMEKWLGIDSTMMIPEHRIAAHYDLAQFWSGQGEPDRAFAHWAHGHELFKTGQPFSRTDHEAFIDANIAEFTPARMTRQRAANRDRIPVFLVGMPRSGATLCERILGAHGMVYGAGARGALSDAFAAVGGGRGIEAVKRIAALPGHRLDKPAGLFITDLRRLAREKARIVDRMTGNYLYLGLAGLIVPEAKFIHCLRDPRDLGLSIFTSRFHAAPPYAHDLADLGWAIAEQLRLMKHWREAMPGRILPVKLSDWADDFEGTLDRVLTHLDLPPDANCIRFHENGDDVRAVSRWRTYEKELAPMIAELEKAGALDGWAD